jgi:geranylgeranyl reductase family protein
LGGGTLLEINDVAIVGGGPSGSVCGKILAEKGLNVVLLEKFGRNRYKPCAGGISTPACELMPIPENLVERKIDNGLIVSASNRSITVGNPAEPGFTVYRNSYDEWLMDEAEKSGATVENNAKVSTVDIKEEKVIVRAEMEGKPKEVSCKVVVGAFGCSPNLYRFFRLSPPPYVMGLAYELFLPEKTIDERIGNAIEVYFDTEYADPGYSWIFPKKSGVNVGVISLLSSGGKMKRLKNFVEEHPVASRKLAGATPKEFNQRNLFASLIPVQPLGKTYGNRFLLVGDAAGLVDPLTYEGIGYALRSGVLAAETIIKAFELNDFSEGMLSFYQSKWMQEIYYSNIKYAQKLNKIMYGHRLSNKLGDTMVELAAEDEDVKTALRYILTRKEPRKRVYEIMMSKKLKLVKKFGLFNSAKILERALF